MIFRRCLFIVANVVLVVVIVEEVVSMVVVVVVVCRVHGLRPVDHFVSTFQVVICSRLWAPTVP